MQILINMALNCSSMCRRHNVVPHECKKTQQLLLQARPACSSSVKFQGCEFLWLVIGILLFCSCVESQEAVRSPRSHGTLTKLDTRFYHSSCPSLQQITASVVASHIQQDPTAGAPLVRMFFHDCAVNVRLPKCAFLILQQPLFPTILFLTSLIPYTLGGSPTELLQFLNSLLSARWIMTDTHEVDPEVNDAHFHVICLCRVVMHQF